jgi:hypothetical protein
LPTATTEWVQALESLARHPNGCSEALMLAHGFTVAFLAGLGRVDKPDPDANARQQHEGCKALDQLVVSGGDAT